MSCLQVKGAIGEAPKQASPGIGTDQAPSLWVMLDSLQGLFQLKQEFRAKARGTCLVIGDCLRDF